MASGLASSITRPSLRMTWVSIRCSPLAFSLARASFMMSVTTRSNEASLCHMPTIVPLAS